MSAIPLPPHDPLFDHLVSAGQVVEWDRALADRRGRLVVAHGRDRRNEAVALAGAYEGRHLPLDHLRAGRWWRWGDLAVVVVSSSNGSEHVGPPLRALLDVPVRIFGITGARPNSIADHCHDTWAIPSEDPRSLEAAHRLVIRLLLVERGRAR